MTPEEFNRVAEATEDFAVNEDYSVNQNFPDPEPYDAFPPCFKPTGADKENNLDNDDDDEVNEEDLGYHKLQQKKTSKMYKEMGVEFTSMIADAPAVVSTIVTSRIPTVEFADDDNVDEEEGLDDIDETDGNGVVKVF